jgi:hypothetical protein
MRAVRVVELRALAQRVEQMVLVSDHGGVEEYTAAGSYPAFHHGVHGRDPYTARMTVIPLLATPVSAHVGPHMSGGSAWSMAESAVAAWNRDEVEEIGEESRDEFELRGDAPSWR